MRERSRTHSALAPPPGLRRRHLLLGGAAAALGGCATLGLSGQAPPPSHGGPALRLVVRGWHSDLGLPAEVVPAPVQALFPGATWLVFGFGDEAYFRAPSPGTGTALGALFPGPGLILVTGLAAPPEQAFPPGQVRELRLPPGGMAAAAGFVAGSLAGLVPVHPGPYPGSVFLPAVPRYSAGYTCNTWTAAGLAAAGLPVRAAGILFASQVRALGEALGAAGY